MFFKSKKNKSNNTPEPPEGSVYVDETKPDKDAFPLKAKNVAQVLSGSADITFREIRVNQITVTLAYVDGLIGNDETSQYILKPLVEGTDFKNAKNEKEIIKLIHGGGVYFADQNTRSKTQDVVSDILNGFTVLIFDQEETAITFNNKRFDKRAVSEPTSENVIKGSKDAFVETLRVNTSLVRRKIKSQNLKIERLQVGRRTHTIVDIIYMQGITNQGMVDEVKKRLSDIDTDGVVTTGSIEEFITDHEYDAFPQIIFTERTDKFCSNILEGRVGLLVDGLPQAFIIPATLLQCLQAPEDYSQNFVVSSAIRFLRFSLMIITLSLPALYVAITTYHQELIPLELTTFFQTSKEGIPFPSAAEIIVMLVAFEILIEAGLRLPKNIGQAVSIVGALIVGQSAVNAKLVSPAVVVVVAFTASSSFAMPNQDFSNALRLWRFVLVILASILGILGVTYGGLIIMLILSSKEIFGVPYLSPFVSSGYTDMDDTIFRIPIPRMKDRPDSLKTIDRTRR